MRIASSTLFNQNVSRMLDLQTDVARYNEQISSGKRILKASEDPTFAARGLELDERLSALDQFGRNMDMLEGRLTQQEAVIDSAQDLMYRVKDLLVQGKNGALSPDDRRFIATEIRERRDELVALANTQNSSGEFIFAGFENRTQPFAEAQSGRVEFRGDQGSREFKISETRRLSEGVSGNELFMAIRNGNGVFTNDSDSGNTGTGRIVPLGVRDEGAYAPENFELRFSDPETFEVVNVSTLPETLLPAPGGGTDWGFSTGSAIAFNGIEVAIEGQPAAGDVFTVSPSANQSIFDTLDNIADALEGPQGSPVADARFTQSLDNAIGDSDQALERLLDSRSMLGGRLNVIDAQRISNEDYAFQLEKAKSDFEDVDLVEAISNLSYSSTILEAAQATFARVQGLSLFNFLR